MSNLRDLKIPAPTDEKLFERLCLELWKRILSDPSTQLVGRKGQAQQGVDIFGRMGGDTHHWIGIQCKVRSTGNLKAADVQSDIQKAKAFNPRLSELIFATTAPRDVTIQEVARQVTDQHQAAGEFSVRIYSWDDILEELGKPEHFDIVRRFFKDLFISYENMGLAIARTVKIEIGVGSTPDTSYELMVGRTAKANNSEDCMGLNYWKGNYFIGDWNNRSLDTFRIPCFASDLSEVFQFTRDAHIVAEWLNGLTSVDDLIDGTEEFHTMLLSLEQFGKLLNPSVPGNST